MAGYNGSALFELPLKRLLTCPSDGPNGGEVEAIPVAMNVRRKLLNCLAAILKFLQHDFQVTLRQCPRFQCLPSSFKTMTGVSLPLSYFDERHKCERDTEDTRHEEVLHSPRVVCPPSLRRARVFCPSHFSRRNQKLLAVLV